MAKPENNPSKRSANINRDPSVIHQLLLRYPERVTEREKDILLQRFPIDGSPVRHEDIAIQQGISTSGSKATARTALNKLIGIDSRHGMRGERVTPDQLQGGNYYSIEEAARKLGWKESVVREYQVKAAINPFRGDKNRVIYTEEMIDELRNARARANSEFRLPRKSTVGNDQTAEVRRLYAQYGSVLTPRQREALETRFGIEGDNIRTLRETTILLGNRNVNSVRGFINSAIALLKAEDERLKMETESPTLEQARPTGNNIAEKGTEVYLLPGRREIVDHHFTRLHASSDQAERYDDAGSKVVIFQGDEGPTGEPIRIAARVESHSQTSDINLERLRILLHRHRSAITDKQHAALSLYLRLGEDVINEYKLFKSVGFKRNSHFREILGRGIATLMRQAEKETALLPDQKASFEKYSDMIMRVARIHADSFRRSGIQAGLDFDDLVSIGVNYAWERWREFKGESEDDAFYFLFGKMRDPVRNAVYVNSRQRNLIGRAQIDASIAAQEPLSPTASLDVSSETQEEAIEDNFDAGQDTEKETETHVLGTEVVSSINDRTT